MDRFVAEQNIRRFVGLLETEADGVKRQTIHGLLIDQEDRFSSRSERLNHTNIFMADLESRIERQHYIVAQYSEQRALAEISLQRLSNMQDTLLLLREYRQHLLDGIDRDCP